jgi:hypothetical protein
MVLRLLKGRGMVSGLFEKKRDAIPPHLKHCSRYIPTGKRVKCGIHVMYSGLLSPQTNRFGLNKAVLRIDSHLFLE